MNRDGGKVGIVVVEMEYVRCCPRDKICEGRPISISMGSAGK